MKKRDKETEENPAESPAAAWGLASLSLAMLMSSLGTSIANVALPTLVQVFGASLQSVQWVVLSYLLVTTTLIVSAGRLGDMVGRRRLILIGLCLYTAASTLCALAPDLPALIGARGAQGLGAAIMMALTMAFVAETVPREKIGSAMGLLGAMSAAGTALGPSLGGILIAGFGWQALFLVNIPLGFAALFLGYYFLPPDRRKPERPSFDYIGTGLLALALGAYALAMTIGHGDFGIPNAALLLAAAGAGGCFVLAERKAPSPLIRLSLFLDPALSAGFMMSALVSTVLMTTLVVGPFYLSRGLGLDIVFVGLIMTVGPVVVALSGIPSGRFVDRFGGQRVIVAGLGLITAGSFALTIMLAAGGVASYIIPLVAITLGYALFQTANNTLVMKDLPPDQRGTISGLLNLSRNIGLITGASVMGAVFALASGVQDISMADAGAIAAGTRITFAVSGVMIMAALFVAQRALFRRSRSIG